MDTLVEKRKFTYEEFLQLEQESDQRYEFWNGEAFAMAGRSRNHNSIGLNIATLLKTKLEDNKCKIYFNDVKLELQKKDYYVYPDILVTCDTEDKDEYVVQNPVLLAEVLSPATEAYDRSVKLSQYRKIKSLRYYLLISQSKPYIEIYGRTSENELYTYDVAEGMEAIIEMPALSYSLPLSKVYEYIEFSSL